MKIDVLTSSTSAVREETPDDIRERAPHWFKMNNRLVTKDDYEFFMMNEPSISGVFNSVKVMNNWEYVSTFYRWLNQLGVTKHDNPRYYLIQQDSRNMVEHPCLMQWTQTMYTFGT